MLFRSLRSAAYEIKAAAEGNPSVPMMLGPMLQRLLEDRFHLKIHRETREGPVYFLTVARGGPKLHPTKEGSCTPWEVPPRPREPGKEYCLSLLSLRGRWPSLEATGVRLDEFSKMLGTVVGRPVIDKTGIPERFDLHVEFSPEGIDLGAPKVVGPGPNTRPESPSPSDPTAPPSIFTAIQEQLGLKLESGRGPVDTLVIDHIEKPSEN